MLMLCCLLKLVYVEEWRTEMVPVSPLFPREGTLLAAFKEALPKEVIISHLCIEGISQIIDPLYLSPGCLPACSRRVNI